MIARYDIEEISSLWKEDKKFDYFLEVERTLLEVLVSHKLIPDVTAAFKNVSINLASVTRSAIDGEAKSERSLTLAWMSVALELGFFF
jgi:adenylosuccinate lyase